jgi:hypothetical protein
MSLQMAIKFLKGGVFEISEVKIVNGEVIDKEFGDLYEFC